MPITLIHIRNIVSVIFISSLFVACTGSSSDPEVSPESDPRSPSSPYKLTVETINNTINVTWQAPITGESVTFYSISRAINGSGNSNFKLLNDFIPADQFEFSELFPSRNEDDRYYYRVIATNQFGSSQSEIVAPVVRNRIITATHTENNIIEPIKIDKYYHFGSNFALSSDGNSIAVQNAVFSSRISADLSNSFILIYNRNKLGEWSKQPIAGLKSNTDIKTYNYNNKPIAFSPDGNTLAIGLKDDSTTINPQSSVRIFTKDNIGLWNSAATTTLLLPSPKLFTSFGRTVTFSPDGQYLAVADADESSGTAYIYSKDITGNWGTTAIAILTSPIPTNISHQAIPLMFSPDSLTLAVGLPEDTVATDVNAGTVHLFTKTVSGRWDNASEVTIKSFNPGIGNSFGANFTFSPDGTSIAISEIYTVTIFGGSPSTTASVQLFTKNQENNWNLKPSQVFKSNSKFSRFGNIAFNSSSTQLAVIDLNASIFYQNTLNEYNGSTLLFSKDNNGNWNHQSPAVLVSSKISGLSGSTISLAFSKKSNTLAVSGINYISIFNTSNIK